jgi:acyl transferase domain-containing protein
MNSFGYGGTNAHVTMDSAAAVVGESKLSNGVQPNGNCKPIGRGNDASKTESQLFVLSAASQTSCQNMATAVSDYMSKQSSRVEAGILLTRLAYTLQSRFVLAYRTGIVASGVDDLVAQLSKLSAQTISRPDSVTSPRIAFVFSGQGGQYLLMGQGLLGLWPCFTASMKRAALCLEECICS